MQDKRGQLTIFIIVAIFIVVAVGLGFFFRSNIEMKSSIGTSDLEIQNAFNYVEECVKLESEGSLFILGLQGGYAYPTNYLYVNKINVSYLYYNQENHLPMLQEFEQELTDFFNENLLSCVDNLSFLEKKGYEIKFGDLNTEITFGEKVIFDVKFPISVRRGDSSFEFDTEYSHAIPVNFLKYYDSVENIIEMQEIHPNEIDLFFLLDQNMNISMTQYEDTLLYLIKDKESILYDKEYVFMFAVEYS